MSRFYTTWLCTQPNNYSGKKTSVKLCTRPYVSFVSYSKRNDRDISRVHCTGLKYRMRAAIVNFSHVLIFFYKICTPFCFACFFINPFWPLWVIEQYSSELLYWHWDNRTPVIICIACCTLLMVVHSWPIPLHYISQKINCRTYACGEQWYIICCSLKTNVWKTNTCLPWQQAVNTIIFSYP